jgi:hypothetical protein
MAPKAVLREIDQLFGYTQRITGLTVTPEPNAVRLDFTTNVPTIPIVEIFRHVQTSAGVLVFNTNDVVAVGFDWLDAALGNTFTEHHARMASLAQTTSYSYRITAADGKRRPAVATGTFVTGRRTGKVVIREIQIWNDGDPGLDASGEFQFVFTVYDDAGNRGPQVRFDRKISSGEVIDLPFGTAPAITLPYAGDTVTVYVLAREFDRGLLEAFSDTASAPLSPPEQPTHSEDDRFVIADAFQQLQLPTNNVEVRLGFSLNSGPWGIHYIVNGWVDVTVTSPPARSVKKSGTRRRRTTTLVRQGARQAVYTPSGKAHLFGFGPDGVIAERLPRVRGERRRKWVLVPTDGADSATVVARDEQHVDLIIVKEGTVRIACRTVGNVNTASVEWALIGEGMQPLLTVLTLVDDTFVIVGLAQSGEVRARLMRDRRLADTEWSALGGRFIGRVAALTTGDNVELFGVTASGEIQYTTWQPDGKAPVTWRSLGEQDATHVFAVEDEDGRHVAALTRDRRLIGALRSETGYLGEWRDLGTLDELGNEEIPQSDSTTDGA